MRPTESGRPARQQKRPLYPSPHVLLRGLIINKRLFLRLPQYAPKIILRRKDAFSRAVLLGLIGLVSVGRLVEIAPCSSYILLRTQPLETDGPRYDLLFTTPLELALGGRKYTS